LNQKECNIDTVTGQQTTFRYDPKDPESRRKLDNLLDGFGVLLPEFLTDNFSQLIENLLWRETASAREGDRNAGLKILLDLGEGDEILLVTIRAGEINAFSHAELYAS
jgi:hypothetical protein